MLPMRLWGRTRARRKRLSTASTLRVGSFAPRSPRACPIPRGEKYGARRCSEPRDSPMWPTNSRDRRSGCRYRWPVAGKLKKRTAGDGVLEEIEIGLCAGSAQSRIGLLRESKVHASVVSRRRVSGSCCRFQSRCHPKSGRSPCRSAGRPGWALGRHGDDDVEFRPCVEFQMRRDLRPPPWSAGHAPNAAL